MTRSDHDAPPFNPLPGAVALLALAIAGIEAALQAGAHGWAGGIDAIGWRQGLVRDLAVPSGVWGYVDQGGILLARDLLRLIGYPFVHWSFTHAAFAVVFVLALGKVVAEALGGAAMLTLFFGASLAGGLAWGTMPEAGLPLAGAIPGAFGLIGGYTFLLWSRHDPADGARWQAFRLIGALMAIQLIWRALFGGGPDWVADIAGFAAGFGLAVLVAPGGGARLLRLRDRARRR
jgi:rhomboid protease GluP